MTLPHSLHFCTDPNVESAFNIHAETVPQVTSMASWAAQAAHQDHTLAPCALEIIENCVETPENIHGNQGDFFISPINNTSNLRRNPGQSNRVTHADNHFEGSQTSATVAEVHRYGDVELSSPQAQQQIDVTEWIQQFRNGEQSCDNIGADHLGLR